MVVTLLDSYSHRFHRLTRHIFNWSTLFFVFKFYIFSVLREKDCFRFLWYSVIYLFSQQIIIIIICCIFRYIDFPFLFRVKMCHVALIFLPLCVLIHHYTNGNCFIYLKRKTEIVFDVKAQPKKNQIGWWVFAHMQNETACEIGNRWIISQENDKVNIFWC